MVGDQVGKVKRYQWKSTLLMIAGDGKIDIGEFQDPFELVTGTCRPETVWIFNKLANWTDRAYPTTDPRFIENGNVEALYRHADTNSKSEQK